MVDCPRCGGTVERLRPLPTGSLSERARRRRDAGEEIGEVCSWCRHEVIEG